MMKFSNIIDPHSSLKVNCFRVIRKPLIARFIYRSSKTVLACFAWTWSHLAYLCLQRTESKIASASEHCAQYIPDLGLLNAKASGIPTLRATTVMATMLRIKQVRYNLVGPIRCLRLHKATITVCLFLSNNY